MKITVIDDIDKDREKACSLVREYLRARDITAEITDFSCSEEFLAAGERPDIALMDIYERDQRHRRGAKDTKNKRRHGVYLSYLKP